MLFSEFNIEDLEIHYDSFNPMKVRNCVLEATTSVGLRKDQEDRMLICPRVFREDVSLFGVFDGTVGDYASEFVQKHFISHLISNEEFKGIVRMNLEDISHNQEVCEKMREVMREVFLSVDNALLEYCSLHSHEFASCTGVVAILLQNLLVLAHVGDSRASLTREMPGGSRIVKCEMLTNCHKPDKPMEFDRIKRCGGTVVYLHTDKPFIRGGDFHSRQSKGERPKQLNYSRAFGGKALKPFGLVAEPDVSCFEILKEDRLILIGSDGLWDTLTGVEASLIAIRARQSNLNGSYEIVRNAIDLMPKRRVRDNISVISIHFSPLESPTA